MPVFFGKIILRFRLLYLLACAHKNAAGIIPVVTKIQIVVHRKVYIFLGDPTAMQHTKQKEGRNKSIHQLMYKNNVTVIFDIHFEKNFNWVINIQNKIEWLFLKQNGRQC
jgi:hypothetical protein